MLAKPADKQDFTQNRLLLFLNSTDDRKVTYALSRIRRYFMKRDGGIKLDSKSFHVLSSFLQNANHPHLSDVISLLGYACLKRTFRNMFLRTKTGVKDLLDVIDTCVDETMMHRVWRLTGVLLKTPVGNFPILQRALKERFIQRLDLETVKSMQPGTRYYLAVAFKQFWRYERNSSELLDKIMVLIASDNNEIVLFSLGLVGSYISNLPRSELTKDATEKLIKLTEHSDLKISTAAWSALIKHRLRSKNDANDKIELGFVYYLEKHPESLCEESVMALALFTRESNVRSKLKHSGLLNTVLRYGIEKKLTEVTTICFNYRYDEDVTDFLAKDPNIVKYIIETVPTASSIAVLLQALAKAPQMSAELASVKSLKTLLKFPKCWPALRSICSSSRYTPQILLSGLCWALEKQVEISFDTSCQNVFQTVQSLMSTPENQRNLALSIPFLVAKYDYLLMHQYLIDLNGLELLMSALEENPEDDGAVHAAYKLCEWYSARRIGFLSVEVEGASTEIKLSRHKKDLLHYNSCQAINCEFNVKMKLVDNAFQTSLLTPSLLKLKPLRSEQKGEMVTILLDDGTRVEWDKDELSQISPVFSAMLNGSFMEANANCVKFPNCSAVALSTLLEAMTSDINLREIPRPVRLEMVELADRLLIPNIDLHIAQSFGNLLLDKPDVFVWVREKGYLLEGAGARLINEYSYFGVYSNVNVFGSFMRNSETQKMLLQEVKEFLQTCCDQKKNQ